MKVFAFASSKKKRRSGSPSLLPAARRIAAGCLTLFLAWSVFLPGASGAMGTSIHDSLTQAFGGAGYLIPLLAAYGLWWRWRSEGSAGLLTLLFGSALLLASSSTFLGEAGSLFDKASWGGILGAAAASFLRSAVGRAGSFLLSGGGWILGAQLLFGLSPVKVLSSALRLIVEDYRGWQKGRRDLKDLLGAAQRVAPAETEGMAPAPAAAKSEKPLAPPAILGGGNGTAPSPPEPAAEPPHPKPPKTARAPARPGGKGGYALPSLDLLAARKSGASTGRPSDEEVASAVSSLEAALKSFEIDARVSGICPGPVITRYEVSPGAGVTVSSIVARSNDIALATRARGIRMIAPIPGKAAIGIEIPNRAPATVTLREVLQSPELASHSSPLAFALGLSSEGAPLCANLAAMPHLLVAGATNSGKSVMVHSLIASILFKRRPDEVKFLLIDPKRIELSLYEGIPHLYDPKMPAKDVRVITNAKEAAKSLKALVRVMEGRYERFQAYRARDIAAFNEEAAARGEDGVFHIVVVIDELADLMVVARDVVEDSIQRLTQMARAVGIHIVLATQRPSVDVITGVIKANLPTRIALRVASKVDSKVILDSVGAEALQGRGDMLFLSPGADLARIQGCFVSSSEIGALVNDLRGKGTPEYATLDTVGAVGEADLSQFGVEPLEFTQALKLVLERKRVSQDLLKSQFGSSARATNLLSLLEVKGFIFKPENSNRWEIYFDKIEDYLRSNFPQVRLDKPGI